MKKSALSRFYPEATFGGFSDVDGTVRFYTRIRALLDELEGDATVLDVGCGRGEYVEDKVAYRRSLRTLASRAKVVGIDVDPAGRTNPCIDEFHLIESDRWPVESGRFDLCVTDWVIEHVPDPAAFIAECLRVLKPGGYLCLRTLNRRSYVGIASRVIPSHFHKRVLKHAQRNRKEEDVFPTLYRCNTIRSIRKTLERFGFTTAVYSIDCEPSYLGFSTLTYFLGVLFHRYTPSELRTTILAFARKAGSSEGATRWEPAENTRIQHALTHS